MEDNIVDTPKVDVKKQVDYPQIERWVTQDIEVYIFGIIPAKVKEDEKGYYIIIDNAEYRIINNYGNFNIKGQMGFITETKCPLNSIIFDTAIAELGYRSKESVDILIKDKLSLQKEIDSMDKTIDTLNGGLDVASDKEQELLRQIQRYEDNEQLIEKTIKLRVLSAVNELVANMDLTTKTK